MTDLRWLDDPNDNIGATPGEMALAVAERHYDRSLVTFACNYRPGAR